MGRSNRCTVMQYGVVCSPCSCVWHGSSGSKTPCRGAKLRRVHCCHWDAFALLAWTPLPLTLMALPVLRQILVLVLAVATANMHIFIATSKV